MSIAIFSDINGNLEALDAILRHIKKNHKIKQIYFLGDAITLGPDSSACLKLLKKNNVISVIGNHEQRIIRYDEATKTKTYINSDHIRFVFSQLDKEDLKIIKDMPFEKKICYKNTNILFTHYAHDKNGILRDDSDAISEKHFEKIFADMDCDIVFFGHMHRRKIIIDENGRSFVCCGSSGSVKTEKTFYTYFDVNDPNGDKNFDIYRMTVPFNRKKFDEKMEKTPLPGKEDYAVHCFGRNYENKGEI